MDIFNCFSYCSLPAVAIPEYTKIFPTHVYSTLLFYFFSLFFYFLNPLLHSFLFSFPSLLLFIFSLSFFILPFFLHVFFFHQVSKTVELSMLYFPVGLLLMLRFPDLALSNSTFNWLMSPLVFLLHKVNLLDSFLLNTLVITVCGSVCVHVPVFL